MSSSHIFLFGHGRTGKDGWESSDVESGVLASQRLDRQRGHKFVNQPDAGRSGRRLAVVVGAGQDDLPVFESGNGQGKSTLDDGALQGQPLPGVQNDGRVADLHQMRRVCAAISFTFR